MRHGKIIMGACCVVWCLFCFKLRHISMLGSFGAKARGPSISNITNVVIIIVEVLNLAFKKAVSVNALGKGWKVCKSNLRLKFDSGFHACGHAQATLSMSQRTWHYLLVRVVCAQSAQSLRIVRA